MGNFSQNFEETGYGNAGYGAGGGFGGSSILWWVIILVLIFLFFFRREGHECNEGRGYGYGGCGGYCAPKPLIPVDCCDFEKGEYETRKVEICEAEKTRALINHKADMEQMEKFQAQLAKETELKNKIYMLESEKFQERRFDQLTGQIAKLQCDMPRTAPCFVPTATMPLCGPCGVEPRRCCD